MKGKKEIGATMMTVVPTTAVAKKTTTPVKTHTRPMIVMTRVKPTTQEITANQI